MEELHHTDMIPSPKSYAISGKIMLSAVVILFAVVIIMVCLHVYARWYLIRARRRHLRRSRRRTHLVFYVDHGNPPTVIASRGLDPALLKSLPSFNYKREGQSGGEENKAEWGLECAVCLSEFEEGERGTMLPKCNHSFHFDCIAMWFHSHSTCPICRSPVDSGDFSPEKSVEVPAVPEPRLIPIQRTEPSPISLEIEGGSSFVGASIKVPRRCQSFSFSNSGESAPSLWNSPGFKSPTSRILSLKRILSRERRSPLPCLGGESATELDVELGLLEGASRPSQTQTQAPR